MTDLGLPHVHSGKVRDIYAVDDDRLLMVTSDRISAFDVVMDEPIPDKGRVLTAMSAFWFDQLGDVVPGHLRVDRRRRPAARRRRRWPARPTSPGRVMLTRRAEMLPVECIVRGYITGSAWKEYRTHGHHARHRRSPTGLLESARSCPSPCSPRRPRPTRGPRREHLASTRAADARRRVAGRPGCATCRVELYRRGADWARERGIIIADTKFELGLVDGELVLCDEVLTPDSSRFWPTDAWEPGATPPSFDKQPVRDYLDGLDWDKTPPPPPLPAEVVDGDERPLRRGVRADHRPVVRRLAGRGWHRCAGAPRRGDRDAATTAVADAEHHRGPAQERPTPTARPHDVRFDWGADGPDATSAPARRRSWSSTCCGSRPRCRWRSGGARWCCRTCGQRAMPRPAYAAAPRRRAGRAAGGQGDWSLSPTDLPASCPGHPPGAAVAQRVGPRLRRGRTTAPGRHGDGRLPAQRRGRGRRRRGADPGPVAVVAAGERWQGNLGPRASRRRGPGRAGAVLVVSSSAGRARPSPAAASPSPEAEAAVAAFAAAAAGGDLGAWLAATASGRELVARGGADDVATAAALDAEAAVPVLDGPRFVARGSAAPPRALSPRRRPLRWPHAVLGAGRDPPARGRGRPPGGDHRALAARPRLRRRDGGAGGQGVPLHASRPPTRPAPGRGRRHVPAVPHQPGHRGRHGHGRGRRRCRA